MPVGFSAVGFLWQFLPLWLATQGSGVPLLGGLVVEPLRSMRRLLPRELGFCQYFYSMHSISDLRNQGIPFLQIVRQFWKQILFFGGAFLFMTVKTVMDLNALEAGEVETVRLWAPIVSFYERFGYWAAVLLPPVLGLVCGSVLCWSLMKRGTIYPPRPSRGEQNPDGNPH